MLNDLKDKFSLYCKQTPPLLTLFGFSDRTRRWPGSERVVSSTETEESN